MKKLVKIGQAAKVLGVSINTLRRWENEGRISSDRTPGGTRLYSVEYLNSLTQKKRTPHPYKKANTPLSTEELLNKVAGIFSPLIRKDASFDASQQPAVSLPHGNLMQTLVSKFLIGGAVLSILIVGVVGWKMASSPASVVQLPYNPNVLAVTSAARFLELNADTQINGTLSVRDSINGLNLEATPSSSTITLNSGDTTLTVTKTAKLDQDVSTTATPTFNTVNLSATKDQLVFQSGGPTGTLTWTPTAARIISLPDLTTTLVGKDTIDSLTNKSISGSSNTITNIANSALTNAKITISAGTNLTGGGDVALGESVTLALKSSPSISGTLTVAGATILSSTLAVTGATTLSSTVALTGTSSSSGTALCLDSSNLVAQCASGSSVTGTGSAGSLAFWSSGTGLTYNSTLFWNTNSSNLGIGTSTPNAKLSVIGAGLFGADYGGYTPPTSGLLVEGNVGIGATTSSNKLDVWGNSNITGNLTLGGSNAALSFTGSAPSLTSGSSLFGIFAGGNVGVGTTTTLGSSFNVNGNQVIGSGFIGGAAPSNGLGIQGNLGVGTTTANSNLTVIGNGTFGAGYGTYTAPSNGLLVQGSVGIGTTITQGTLNLPSQGSIIFNISGTPGGTQYNQVRSDSSENFIISFGGSAGKTLRILNQQVTGSSNTVAFFTGSGSTNFQLSTGAVMGFGVASTITGPSNGLGINGNLGIGTTTANAKLSVIGGGVFGNDYGGAAAPVNGLGVEGNVGIGTTSPLQALHVVGQCVTGDSILITEDGKAIRVDQVKPGMKIYTLNQETGKLVPAQINALLDMGIRSVFRLTTRSGKSIRTTGNHPYLVQMSDIRNQISERRVEESPIKDAGWVKVTDLKVGDQIAVVDKLSSGGEFGQENEKQYNADKQQTNSNINSASKISQVYHNSSNISSMATANLKKIIDQPKDTVNINGSLTVNTSANKPAEILEEIAESTFNWADLSSKGKLIEQNATINQPNFQWPAMSGVEWDPIEESSPIKEAGWVKVLNLKVGNRIAVADSTSLSVTQNQTDQKHAGNEQQAISNSSTGEEFLDVHNDFFLSINQSVNNNANIPSGRLIVNSLPYSSSEEAPKNPGATNSSPNQPDVKLIQIAANTSKNVSTEKNSFISNESIINEVGYQWPASRSLLDQRSLGEVGDVGWDPIVSIEYTGEEQVWDLTIEGTHNFLANDIVAHNTYISGNVGIGATTSSNKLDVWGNSNVTGNVGIGTSLTVTNLGVFNGGINVTGLANLASLNATSVAGAGLISCSDGTNSKLLYNSSTGQFSCGTDQSGGLSGGAANGVAFWSSSSALSNSVANFYWDSANNRLGIGNSNPQYALDVTGTGNFGNLGVGGSLVVTGNVGVGGSLTVTSAAVLSTLGSGIVQSNSLGGLSSGPVNLGSATYVSGILGSTNGGTGFSTYTTGDLIYASATDILSKLARGTNGQCLTSNSSTILWGNCSGSNGVTGSGISGQITFWNGANSVTGDYNFFYDSANVRVGIGTSSPTQTFQVNPTNLNPFVVTSAGNVGINTTSPGGALVVALGNVGIGVTTPSSLFAVGSGNTANFTVSGTGNVGVGASLTVTSLGTFNGGITTNNFFLTTSPTSGYVLVTDAAGKGSWTDLSSVGGTGGNIGAWTLSGNNLYPDSLSYNVGIGTSTVSQQFQVNQANNAFVVTSSGNVGVGTTTPAFNLQVIGTGNFGNIGVGGSLVTTGNVGVGQSLSVTDLGVFNKGLNVTGLANLTGNVGVGTSLTVSSGTDLLSSLNVRGNSQLSTLSTSGNVGIGGSLTTTGLEFASGGLRVNGFSDLTGNIGVGGTATFNSLATFSTNLALSSGQFLAPNGTASLPSFSFTNSPSTGLWSPSTNALSLTTNGSGTSGITITAGGNVGIGITSPGATLDVSGGFNVNGSAANTITSTANPGPALTIRATAGQALSLRSGSTHINFQRETDGVGLHTINGASTTFTFSSNSAYDFQRQAVSRLYINDSGNVGIGSSTATSKFGVGGNAAIGSNYGWLAAPTNGLAVEGNVGIGITTANSALTVNGGVSIGSSNIIAPTNGLFVLGNVGIGFTTPINPLVVSGAATIGSGYNGYTPSSNGLLVQGNVGIGATSAVGYNLDVWGTARFTGATTFNGAATFSSTGSFASTLSIADGTAATPGLNFSSDTDTGLWRSGTNLLALTTNGSGALQSGTTINGLSVNASGNVGIGNTNPGAALEITGNLLFTKETARTISIANSTTTNTAGAQLNITGAAGAGTGTGGVISITAGATTTNNVNGGALNLTGGQAGGAGVGVGGAVSITGGSSSGNDSTGGAVTIAGGTAAGTVAGAITIPGGASSGGTNGGLLSITGGRGGPAANGGAISITTAAGGSTSGSSGTLSLATGSVTSGTVGSILFLNGGAGLSGFNASGNLGIGTTSPGGSLVVASGNMGIGFTTPDRLTQIASDINIVGSNASLLGAAGTQFSLTGGSASGLQKKLVLGIDTTDNYGVIQAGNTDGTNYALALNPAGGNVGIGATTANNPLFVNGAASIGANNNIAAPTNGLLVQGNVGIGTTGLGGNGGFNLDVWGTARITGNTTLTGTLTTSGAATFSSTSTFGGNLTLSSGQFLAPNGTSSLPSYSFTNSTSTGMYSPSSNALSLQTNGASTPPLTITAGGNVGIGITAPSGVFQVGSSASAPVLFASSLTGNVGIGTIATGAKLDLLGAAANFDAFRMLSNSSTGYTCAVIGRTAEDGNLCVAGSAGHDSNISAQSDIILRASSGNLILTARDGSGSILFGTGSTDSEKVRISSGGNVGIGTASPVAQLDVRDTLSSTGLHLYVGSSGGQFAVLDNGNVGIGTTTPSGSLQVQGNVGIGWTNASPAFPGLGLSVFGNVGIGTTTPNSNLVVVGNGSIGGSYSGVTSPTNGLLVQGNVGIGTTGLGGNGGFNLDVWGTARITGNTTLNGTLTTSGNVGVGGSITGYGALNGLNVTGLSNLAGLNAGTTTLGATTLSTLTLTGNNAALTFSGTTPSITTTGNTSFSVFTNAGNVGVGTSSNLLGALTVRGLGTTTGITLQTYGSNLTQGLTVLDNGNVGIGTTAPDTTSKLTLTDTTNVQLALQSLGSSTKGYIGQNNSGTFQIATNRNIAGTFSNTAAAAAGINLNSGSTDSNITFYTSTLNNSAPTERVRIDKNGNVGIGTASPIAQLDVRDTLSSTGLHMYVGSSGGQFAVLDNGNVGIGTTLPSGTLQVQGNVGIGWTNASPVFPSLGLSVFGNVGIGTTTPTSKLVVVGNGVIGQSYTGIAAPTSGLFVEGNVGIGATTSNNKLDVWGNARITGNLTLDGSVGNLTSTGVFYAANGSASAPSYSFTNLTNAGLWTNGNGLLLTTGGLNTSGITITAAGNVGIGTTFPSGSLVVASGNVGIGSTGRPQGNLHVTNTGGLYDDLITNQAAVTNLVVNPNFETGTANWTGAGVGSVYTQSPDRAYFGRYSFKFAGTNINTSADSACMVVSASTAYTFSAYVYFTSGGTGAHTMDIFEYSNSNCTGSTVDGPNTSYTSASDTWRRVSVIQTMASGTGSVKVRFVNDSNSTGTDYFDGVQFEQASSASPYADGSFGPGYVWSGTAHGSTSTRTAGAIFGYQTLNMAGGLGAVGIGTSNPALRIEQDGTGAIASFFDTATEVMRIADGGNVGIGFTTPDRLTQIASDINIVGSNASLLGAAGTQLSLTGSSAAGTSKKLVLGIDTTDNYGVIQAGNTDGTNYALSLNPAGGNVGIGTTSPRQLLVVGGGGDGSGDSIENIDSGASGRPILQLLRNTVASGLFGTANGVGSLTAGTVAGDTVLRATTNLHLSTNAGTTVMTLTSGGNVGIGFTSPGGTYGKLTVSGGIRILDDQSAKFDIGRYSTGSANSYIKMGTNSNALIVSNAADTVDLFSILNGGNVGVGTITPAAPFEVKATGTGVIAKFTSANTIGCTLADGGTITCTSDITLKKNIEDLSYGLDDVMKLHPVGFNWKTENDATAKSLGFIAQEIENVLPKLVTTDEVTGLKELNSIGLIPVLVKSIQQQQAQLSPLTATFTIDSAGNVGIGTTNSQARLQVTGDSGQLLTLSNSLGNVFSVDASGSAKLAGTLTTDAGAFDVAEDYPTLDDSIEPGDVVSLGGSTIIKSSSPYEPSIIGIISTKPGIRLQTSDIGYQTRPVALAGRVPVKVSTENGAIAVGDYLTSSSIPGVAMKAIRAGPVVGKALEDFNCEWSAVCTGKILIFINVSFADPGNFLASLSLDADGNLIAPKVKVDKLLISENVGIGGTDPSSLLAYDFASTGTSTDVLASLKNLDQALESQESRVKSLEEQTATGSAALAELRSKIEQLGNKQATPAAELNLTPPDILYATGSAQLVNLKVTSEATVSGLLASYDLNVSNSLKSLGTTTLAKTNVAGDLTVDGTLAIENGSEINVLGTLFLQKSILAQALDIFNGKVTIDPSGKIAAYAVQTNKLTILGTSIGTATLPANQTSVTVATQEASESAKVFVTPTTPTDKVLSVTNIKTGLSFDVSILTPASVDINFNWWIVRTE